MTFQTIRSELLATATGGMHIPPDGSSATPTPFGSPLLRGDSNAPRCEKSRSWLSPHGIGILSSGNPVLVPMASCPAVKRPAVP